MNRCTPGLAVLATCLVLLAPQACSAEPTREEQDRHETLRALSNLGDPVATTTDADTCDVNLDSRRISANLLTGQVEIRTYAQGRQVAKRVHHRSAMAPSLAQFSFEVSQTSEP